jgi:hypothetical protein
MQDAFTLLGLCLILFAVFILPIIAMERTERKLRNASMNARSDKR